MNVVERNDTAAVFDLFAQRQDHLGRPLAVQPALAALLVSAPSLARESFVLVGGGPMPRASQVSIEKNAIWIESLMAARPFATRQVLFASGPGGHPDVVWHSLQIVPKPALT